MIALYNSIINDAYSQETIEYDWEVDTLDSPTDYEKEEESCDSSLQNSNEDEFSTCSDESSSYEESINQIATVQTEDTGGIQLPFGMKEGTKISC